jgi:hypothetical protein
MYSVSSETLFPFNCVYKTGLLMSMTALHTGNSRASEVNVRTDDCSDSLVL